MRFLTVAVTQAILLPPKPGETQIGLGYHYQTILGGSGPLAVAVTLPQSWVAREGAFYSCQVGMGESDLMVEGEGRGVVLFAARS